MDGSHQVERRTTFLRLEANTLLIITVEALSFIQRPARLCQASSRLHLRIALVRFAKQPARRSPRHHGIAEVPTEYGTRKPGACRMDPIAEFGYCQAAGVAAALEAGRRGTSDHLKYQKRVTGNLHGDVASAQTGPKRPIIEDPRESHRFSCILRAGSKAGASE